MSSGPMVFGQDSQLHAGFEEPEGGYAKFDGNAAQLARLTGRHSVSTPIILAVQTKPYTQSLQKTPRSE